MRAKHAMADHMHEDFAGEKCAACGEEIDEYGNTESAFQFCCFPDCGCDGARLCMAGEASDRALGQNIEGMWNARHKSLEQRRAIAELIVTTAKERKT